MGIGLTNKRDFDSDSDLEENRQQRKKPKPAYSGPISFVSSGSKTVDSNLNIQDLPSLVPQKRAAKKPSNQDLQNSQLDKVYGIGAKIMKQLGYVPGEGLGKDGSGVAAPIDVRVRPKNAGLSYGGEEQTESEREKIREMEKKRIQLNREKGIITKEDEELYSEIVGIEGPQIEEEVFVDDDWKRSSATKRRIRTKQKKYEIVSTASTEPEKMVIFDYRYSSSPQIKSSAEMLTSGKGSYPELRYNVGLLFELTKSEHTTSHNEIEREKRHLEKLAYDIKALRALFEEEESDLTRMKNFIQMLKVFREKCANHQFDAFKLVESFIQLRELFPEYKTYHEQTSTIFYSLLVPLLTEDLNNWDFVHSPTEKDLFFSTLHQFLVRREPSLRERTAEYEDDTREDDENLYYQIIEEIVPKWAAERLLLWNPKDFSYGNTLMLILEKMYNNSERSEDIFKRLIFPILEQGILKDQNTANENEEVNSAGCLWAIPWAISHKNVQQLLPHVRQRIARALTINNWQPKERSAFETISPWKDVFDKPSMESFVLRCIVPKLSLELKRVEINPAHQDTQPIQWVIEWKDIISLNHLVKLLITDLFPRWHQILALWLSSSPNFNEIQQWYLQWKSLFPKEFLVHPAMETQFSFALDVIQSAHRGDPLPPPPAHLTHIEPQTLTRAAQEAAFAQSAVGRVLNQLSGNQTKPNKTEDEINAGREELIVLLARLGAPHSITPLPTARRTPDGLEVMRYGKLSIAFDLGQILIRNPDGRYTAAPPLEALLAKAIGNTNTNKNKNKSTTGEID